MFDVVEMLDWDMYMVDGFTVERLHLRAKFVLEYICDPRMVEDACLAAILTAQVGRLQRSDCESRSLFGLSGNPVEHQGLRVANSMRVRGFELHLDDVVFDQKLNRCGRILACVQHGEDYMFLVSLFNKVEDVSWVASKWRDVSEDVFVAAESCIPVLGWQECNDDNCLLVLQRFATDF